jgi:ABC-type transport system involved in multi-copper enzyme maturation permease subunit
VWDNPVLWREVCSWALGRKIVLIRIAYWLLFAAAVAGTYLIESAAAVDARGRLALPLVPLLVLSLMLVAALSVTSITGERDGRSLDLLLVTDLTPKEIVFGKLFGSLYNTKEIVLLPAILVVGLGMAGAIGWENVVYLLAGWGIMTLFVAMLGIHCGMMYANSQTAISVSLGTLFFLLVGIGICIALMVALGDPYGASFQVQYWPFVGIMAPGSLGLYLALGAGRPSRAIAVTAVVCPAATFWAITSYFLGFTLAILLVTGAAYGFATITMMIPAIHEFDVTTGRTTTEP